MALRKVTVEVTATYVVEVEANNATEARLKADSMVLFDEIAPTYMSEVILDVKPIKE